MKPEELQGLRDVTPQPHSIYLAGPFFTPVQIARIEIVERLCQELLIPYHSPRKFLVLRPDSSMAERELVFVDNVRKIALSSVVLANLDQPKDTGTIWEMGFAFALGRPVVGFSLADAKMNVMLANGCEGFLSSEAQVREFLAGRCGEKGSSWEFNWGVAQKWQKEIF